MSRRKLASDVIGETSLDLIREPAPDLIQGGHWFADKDMRNMHKGPAGPAGGTPDADFLFTGHLA